MSMKDKVVYSATALVWVLVLLIAWGATLSFAADNSGIRDAALVGGGVFTAKIGDIVMHIFRKKPEEK